DLVVRCNRGCHDSPALVLEAGVGAWIVKRAASTDYRPGVRPLQSTRRGARFRRPHGTYHRPRNARLADLISEADQTYDPYFRTVVMDSGPTAARRPGM